MPRHAVAAHCALSSQSIKSFRDFSGSRQRSSSGDGSKSEFTDKKNLNVKAGFWEFRPFSRVVSWGRDFKTCVKYLNQNVLEAFGFVPYKPRKNFYRIRIKNAASDLSTG